MTTPRIEEKKGRKIGEDEYTEHWSLDGHSYIQVPKWVIIQTHQAGIDEAMEVIREEMIRYPDTGKVQEDAYNYALLNAEKAIKALQDNK